MIANRPGLMGLMTDKRKLADRLATLGMDTASTSPAAHWREFAAKHGYPFVLKPATGTGGSRGLKIITDEKAMAALADGLGDEIRRYILQEYVGSKETEFTVGVLTDRDGRLIDSIVMQRKLTAQKRRNKRQR